MDKDVPLLSKDSSIEPTRDGSSCDLYRKSLYRLKEKLGKVPVRVSSVMSTTEAAIVLSKELAS